MPKNVIENKVLRSTEIPIRVQNFSKLPDRALLSVKEICLLTGRSRSSIWRDVKSKRLPKPVNIGANSVRWSVSIVREFLCGQKKNSRN